MPVQPIIEHASEILITRLDACSGLQETELPVAASSRLKHNLEAYQRRFSEVRSKAFDALIDGSNPVQVARQLSLDIQDMIAQAARNVFGNLLQENQLALIGVGGFGDGTFHGPRSDIDLILVAADDNSLLGDACGQYVRELDGTVKLNYTSQLAAGMTSGTSSGKFSFEEPANEQGDTAITFQQALSRNAVERARFRYQNDADFKSGIDGELEALLTQGGEPLIESLRLDRDRKKIILPYEQSDETPTGRALDRIKAIDARLQELAIQHLVPACRKLESIAQAVTTQDPEHFVVAARDTDTSIAQGLTILRSITEKLGLVCEVRCQTIDDCLNEIAANQESACAVLTRSFVCGDETAYFRFDRQIHSKLVQTAPALIGSLVQWIDSDQCLGHGRNVAGEINSDLKGDGQRVVQFARYLMKLSELVDRQDPILAKAFAQVEQATEVLCAIKVALHMVVEKAADQDVRIHYKEIHRLSPERIDLLQQAFPLLVSRYAEPGIQDQGSGLTYAYSREIARARQGLEQIVSRLSNAPLSLEDEVAQNQTRLGLLNQQHAEFLRLRADINNHTTDKDIRVTLASLKVIEAFQQAYPSRPLNHALPRLLPLDRELILHVRDAMSDVSSEVLPRALRTECIQGAIDANLLTEVRQSVETLLANSGKVGLALRLMQATGILNRLAPEFDRALHYYPYQTAYSAHKLSLGEHSLQCVEHGDLLALRQRGGATVELPEILTAYKVLEAEGNLPASKDPAAESLAQLLHDLGKAYEIRGRIHQQVGADIAMNIALRLGFDVERATTVARRIDRHHDLTGYAKQSGVNMLELRELAASFVSVEDLASQLRLALSDKLATGNRWSARNTARLCQAYRELANQIAGIEETADTIALNVVEVYPPESTLSLDDAHNHLAQMPWKYHHSCAPDEIACHIKQRQQMEQRRAALAEQTSNSEFRDCQVSILPPLPGTAGLRVVISATDAPQIAMFQAAALFPSDIVAARLNTSSDGFAFNVFEIIPQKNLSPLQKQSLIEEICDLVMTRPVRVHHLSTRNAAPPIHHKSAALRIETDWFESPAFLPQRDSGYLHIVVEANPNFDRPGLGFEFFRVLAESGLNVVEANLGAGDRGIYNSILVHPSENRNFAISELLALRQRLYAIS